MKCTAEPCNGILKYKGGENTEDYGCNNSDCWAREIKYHGNVKVRPGWYYLAGYHLPFRWIDVRHQRPDYNYGWYSLVGDPSRNVTELQGLKLVERSYGGHNWNQDTQDFSATTIKECVQETLHTVPYFALPANNDFLDQFHIIRDRMMNEWLGSGTSVQQQSPYQEAIQEIDNEIISYLTGHLLGPLTHTGRSTGSVIITSQLQRLIEIATSDSIDDASERAALEACHELKKILDRGSYPTRH